MPWLVSLALGLVQLANGITSFLNTRQMITAAQAELLLKQLQRGQDDIRSAMQINTEVEYRTAGPDAARKLRDDPANLYRD